MQSTGSTGTRHARITDVTEYQAELPFTVTQRYRCDRGHSWTGPPSVVIRGSDGLPRCVACFRELVTRDCGLIERECGRVTPVT